LEGPAFDAPVVAATVRSVPACDRSPRLKIPTIRLFLVDDGQSANLFGLHEVRCVAQVITFEFETKMYPAASSSTVRQHESLERNGV
jgi:hypothetical protein